jgi:hypothetical protein
VSRFAKVIAVGAVTAGILAASTGAALAGNRHISSPPQGAAAVSVVQDAGQGTVAPDVRHVS